MKRESLLIKLFAAPFFAAAVVLSGCSNSSNYSKEMQAKIDSMKIVLNTFSDGNSVLQKPGNF